MFYSQDQVEAMEQYEKQLHDLSNNGASLCQFKGRSCVRCCMPHIGGDSHLFDHDADNRSNNVYRYLGPDGLLMQFNNFLVRGNPSFSVSKHEDSFEDVGKEEMERRFRERTQLFQEIFDPEDPLKSLQEYEEKIKEISGYSYKSTKENMAGQMAAMFCGGSVRFDEKAALPECFLLGVLSDEKSIGCLGHPKANNGFEGRKEAGYFRNSSCSGCSCTISKEFGYLSDVALEIFDNATKNMSWYEYSRHSTAVLVSYLRAYDYLLQKMAEKIDVVSLPLSELTLLINRFYDQWSFRLNTTCRTNLIDCRLKKYPQVGIEWHEDMQYFYAAADVLTLRKKLLKNKEFDEAISIGKKHFIDVVYRIVSTEKGYSVIFNLPDGDREIEVEIDSAGRLIFVDNEFPYWRIVANYSKHEDVSDNEKDRGRAYLLGQIRGKVFPYEDMMYSKEYFPMMHSSEAVMYKALATDFSRGNFEAELTMKREAVDRFVESL